MLCRSILLLYALFSTSSALSTVVTLVYNLRVAETIRTQTSSLRQTKPSIVIATPFYQKRQSNNGISQSTGGLLGTYIYTKEHFYARWNVAGGRTHGSLNPSTGAQTEADDILFTVGYGSYMTSSIELAFSCHFGIPTHQDESLLLPQFGTGHVGLGAQLDCALLCGPHGAFLAAARLIHFFPRSYVPVVPNSIASHFAFNIGNVADLLFKYQHGYEQHQFEIGYNPTFIFDASIYPAVPGLLSQIDVITQNVFTSYRYGFSLGSLPSAIIVGVSYGFGNRPAPSEIETIVTAWFSWGINF
jgi:hypothetical protein